MHHQFSANITVDSNTWAGSIEDLHCCILQRSCTRNYQNRMEKIDSSYKNAAEKSTCLQSAWWPVPGSCSPTLPAGTQRTRMSHDNRVTTLSYHMTTLTLLAVEAALKMKVLPRVTILNVNPCCRQDYHSHTMHHNHAIHQFTHHTQITLEISFCASS